MCAAHTVEAYRYSTRGSNSVNRISLDVNLSFLHVIVWVKYRKTFLQTSMALYLRIYYKLYYTESFETSNMNGARLYSGGNPKFIAVVVSQYTTVNAMTSSLWCRGFISLQNTWLKTTKNKHLYRCFLDRGTQEGVDGPVLNLRTHQHHSVLVPILT